MVNVACAQPEFGPEERKVEDHNLSTSKVKVGRCIDCGVERRLAAGGRCFSCYRREREANNPVLRAKRNADRCEYSRRRYEAEKLKRFSLLVDEVNVRVLAVLRSELAPAHYAKIQMVIREALNDALRNWMRDHDRRSKLSLEIERIEAEGKTAIVVAVEDVMFRRQGRGETDQRSTNDLTA